MTSKVLAIQDHFYYFPTQKELAKYLGVTVHTLMRWRKEGKDSAFNGLIRIEDYNPKIHTFDRTVIMDKI